MRPSHVLPNRHAGFLALPAALFGMCLAPGLLNGGYAAMLVGGCLASTLRLEPPVQAAIVPFSQVESRETLPYTLDSSQAIALVESAPGVTWCQHAAA